MKNIPPSPEVRTRSFELLRQRYLAAIKTGARSKQFFRWQHFWSQRQDARGNLPSGTRMLTDWHRHRQQELGPAPVFPWESVGPTQLPVDERLVSTNPGLGRINCIAFAPGVMYAGAATGGLWKSTNGGATWVNMEVGLPLLGISDIGIDPQNPAIIYLGTGDRDHGDGPGFGVIKSTDGGLSFSQLVVDPIRDSLVISRLLINPQNPSIVLAAATSGIYRSIDAGNTWSRRASAGSFATFYGMEFKPGDPSVVYAASNAIIIAGNPILVSRDGGDTWTPVSGGIPNTNVSRVAIAVTPAAPDLVYAIFVKDDRTFKGFYRSNDSGVTWTLRAAEPNLLGRANGGDKDTEGQGEYDLALAASPTKPAEVFVGGINIWKSTDGGKKWDRKTFWNRGDARERYVHADQHALAYFPGHSEEIWVCNDGGIFRSTDGGKNWADRSNGLQVSEFYTVATSPKGPHALLGAQDNGVVLFDGAKFRQIYGADGLDGVFSHEDLETLYFAIYDGRAFRSNNLGRTHNETTGDIPEAERLTPNDTTFGAVLTIDPSDAKIVYFGVRNLFRSENNGRKWSKINALPAGTGNELIVAVRIAPTDPQRIYVARRQKLFTSADKGATWSDITPALGSSFIRDVAVHSAHPNSVWVAFGDSGPNRVFRSFSAGTTWQNITGPVSPASGSLPPFNISAIVSQAGLSNLVYVGTDVGVFLTHDGLTPNWIPFNANLPTVVVSDLEIHPFTGRLMAATFGRGLWQAPLFVAPEFSIFSAPNEIRLPRGSSKDVTIIIARSPGLDDSILLSILNLPTGITAPPVSTPVNSAPLKLSVGAAVPFGTYNLLVQGRTNGIKNTGPLKLIVKAFTLSLSAPDLTLRGGDNQNKSADVAVTIQRSPGFGDSVQLSLEGIPIGAPPGAGASASITPEATIANTAVLHTSVERFAPDGGFVLTVRGVSGNFIDTVQLAVEILASDVSSPPGPVQP
jgi:photosystem II stability/assembly factor-like uncharacterized protein